MRYLITKHGGEPFFTDFFSVENHWEWGMVVYDINKRLYFDGTSPNESEYWHEIQIDHL